MHRSGQVITKHDWSKEAIAELFALPFMELLYQAHQTHRTTFDPNEIQISTLLSIKTGGCPEDCKYCSQSVHYKTAIERDNLMSVATVVEKAKEAKANGAERFCMGAAWREPKGKSFERVCEMVSEVKALGLETCATLGMLSDEQAAQLKDAGLDFYNHNLDTSPEFYSEVITSRTYQDRLNTLTTVHEAGIKVCCGGILGLGETRQDRIGLLHQLATMPQHPESVPINRLVPVEGTPLGDETLVDPIEFVRTIAVARLLMPRSVIRLAAGRENMPESLQALCFFVGANSIFYGDKLLTEPNNPENKDKRLFEQLGLKGLAVN